MRAVMVCVGCPRAQSHINDVWRGTSMSVAAARDQEVATTRVELETRARALDEKEQGLLFLEVQLEETSVELERREVALGMSGVWSIPLFPVGCVCACVPDRLCMLRCKCLVDWIRN